MKILCQRDPMWASLKLGVSNLTCARFGCTTTSISMLSDYFGCYKSPGELASNKNYYTRDGLILWSATSFACFRHAKRLYGYNATEIDISLKDPNKAVILEIWNKSHWVVAIKRDLFGNYVIADPWDGKKKTIKAKDITGSSHFIKI